MRKKKHAEHVNHERWLVSYADFITLLFAFFVVMFATSQVDKKKAGKFASAVQSALGIHGVPSGAILGSPVEAALAGDRIILSNLTPYLSGSTNPASLSPQGQQTLKALEDGMGIASFGDGVSVRVDRRGVAVSLSEGGFFATGEARLKPESFSTLREVALMIKDTAFSLSVEGHTDDVPIRSAAFPSNWELSTARATSVVRFLVDQIGVEPGRIAASGFAEFRPSGDNRTSEGRAMNRRVDILLLTETQSH